MRKVIDPLIYDYMTRTGSNLFNAASSGDVELALAVLTKIQTEVDSYINALKEG
jgi:hypothetical protein